MVAITGIESRTVTEGSAFQYTATLKDEDNNVIASSSVDTITLTLYELPGLTIINSKNGTDVYDTGGGTLHASSGLFTMLLLAADNPIVNATIGVGDLECHEALFKIGYSSTKTLNHTVQIYVKQLDKVT